MKPEITILQGDNRAVMKTFADNSFQAIVTDPPYELGFMGKKWDGGGIAFEVALWRECLRVLKPGGHLLSFGGSRTYHRMACAIEDAGFEIRDMIEWIYGSGFPKSLDVSKAMDKANGNNRAREKCGGLGSKNSFADDEWAQKNQGTRIVDAPIGEAAKLWQGYGTALKPAHEPICVARKPLIGTVVENVLAHGTGAINIDGCWIESEKETGWSGSGRVKKMFEGGWSKEGGEARPVVGRFPANLILDEAAAAALDAQSGELSGGAFPKIATRKRDHGVLNNFTNEELPARINLGDTGGASRFFYTAKASGSDRGNNVKGALPLFGVAEEEFRNTHPTVKPLALMTYLLKLVVPFGVVAGCKVLDPFCGSGTTAVACKQLGIDCTGIELEAENIAIIYERLSG